MKNQFILNPSMEFIEEIAKVFSIPDGYTPMDEYDIHLIMLGAFNALLLESNEASGSDRTDKIINDIKSFFSVADSYNINNAENMIISIEYPANDELTIDEVENIINAISNITSSTGVIWGANPVDRNTINLKLIATNLKKA